MSIERVKTVSTDQWLAWRLNYVGASEVAIPCGEGGYASAAMLFAQKKGLRPQQADSGPMRRGRWAESATLEALLECYPTWEVRRAKVHVRDTELRLACTPDAFACRPDREGFGIVQCKAVSRAVFRNKWLNDPQDRVETGDATPPTSFRLQTLAEEMLNDTPWGVLAVLIVGEYDWQFRMFDIERDAVLEDRIRYNVAKFWSDFLDPGIMPPLDFERDAELVRQLYPKDNGQIIDLRTNNRALVAVDELTETSAAIKRMQKQESALKTELTSMLGENTFGMLADGRCLSWRTQHRRAYAVEACDYRVLRVLKQVPEQE